MEVIKTNIDGVVIQTRKQKEKTLADSIIADHLFPIINKVMAKDLLIDEVGNHDTLLVVVLGDADGENMGLNNTDLKTR